VRPGNAAARAGPVKHGEVGSCDWGDRRDSRAPSSGAAAGAACPAGQRKGRSTPRTRRRVGGRQLELCPGPYSSATAPACSPGDAGAAAARDPPRPPAAGGRRPRPPGVGRPPAPRRDLQRPRPRAPTPWRKAFSTRRLQDQVTAPALPTAPARLPGDFEVRAEADLFDLQVGGVEVQLVAAGRPRGRRSGRASAAQVAEAGQQSLGRVGVLWTSAPTACSVLNRKVAGAVAAP